ncbi:MAG: glycosyltransferase [Fidelibacterota bacterium]|nr:MAG: glycosyltransferase [Candidatus Neomarinimicrobiota bacterium]
MNLVLIIFQGCLVVYLLALLWFLLGLLRPDPPRTHDQPPVSVIVAARNGDLHLSRLLACLMDQDYPEDKLEIVIVNDGLSEVSKASLDEATSRDQRIKVVDSASGDQRLTHKKRALDAGIRHSRGEVLLFTDVDCQMEPAWVRSMTSYFTPGTDYVVGWSQVAAGLSGVDDVELTGPTAPFKVFERLDFAMLMLAARGATMMGTPWASSGQNQAYRRSVYERAGGFQKLAHRLQGDDSLFLQVARRRAKARITYATDPDARIVTDSAESLVQLIYQRIRWSGDAVAMWRFNPVFFPIPVATFGVNALIIVLVLAALADSTTVLPVLIPGILLKALVEATFLLVGSTKLSLGGLRQHFPLWFLMQIPYVTLVGLASFWGNRLPWRRPVSGKRKTGQE